MSGIQCPQNDGTVAHFCQSMQHAAKASPCRDLSSAGRGYGFTEAAEKILSGRFRKRAFGGPGPLADGYMPASTRSTITPAWPR
jgi:hypothetical protein